MTWDVTQYFVMNASQQDALDLFPGSTTGDFAASFPDLYQATVGFQSLDFESTSRYIQANASSPEVFEAFGLKIPSEQLTNWGTVVILCIQLYLFVYLRGFKRPLEQADEAWNVGWFATNDGFLSRSIFFVTVFVLPFITVALLSKHALDRRIQQAQLKWSWHFVASKQFLYFIHDFRAVPFLILGCAISLVLGYLIWANRPRIRLEPAQSRSQLFE